MPRLAAAAALAASLTVLSGCTMLTASIEPAEQPPSGPVYTLAVDGDVPGGTSQRILPGEGVTFTAATLTAAGKPPTAVPVAADGTVDTGPLPPNSTSTLTLTRDYGMTTTVAVTAGDADADHTLGVRLSPDGATVGVGAIIEADFTSPISDADKTAVTSHITVAGAPAGSWRWIDDDTALWRPAHFWPAGATPTVTADLAGVSAHTVDGTAVWGPADPVTASFTVGRSTVIDVDLAAHTATATVDGAPVRTMAISGGKPGYETTTGIKTVLTRDQVVRMTNAGVTDEPYDLQVPWSMRITGGGEYLHSADWNTSLGAANTSHGCTNLSSADARWLYDNTLVGDPVITVGPANPIVPGDGIGSWWNIPAADWATR